MLIAGYDDDREAFYVRNSWTERWVINFLLFEDLIFIKSIVVGAQRLLFHAV